MDTAERSGPLRLALFAIAWLALTKAALDAGALLLPRSIAESTSLEAFLLGAQLTTTLLGLAAARLVLKRPASDLGILRAPARALRTAVLAAPIVFTVAFAAGLAIALPTLLAEIRRGGAAVSRQDLGDFGRALREAPVWVTVAWIVVVGPIGEELLFRGALWSAVQRLTAVRAAADADPESLPPELLSDGPIVHGARRLWGFLRDGGFATLAAAALFAAMHADVRGGVGILRLVSAACLGLACGAARQATGTVVVSVALHASYNLLGLGQSRGWFASEALPVKFGLPTAIPLLAAGCALVLAALALARRRAPR